MVKLLGIIDLFAAIILFSFLRGFDLPLAFVSFVLFGLIVKALMTLLQPGGIIDLIFAVIIILSFFFSLPVFLYFLGVIVMTVKGFNSLVTH